MQVVNASLLDAPDEFPIVQCISADCAMGINSNGKEIPCLALALRKKYPLMADFCKSYGPLIGDVIMYTGPDGRVVFNLVTKLIYYSKPNYDSMTRALDNLRWLLIENRITKLAIPKLGAGLDGLNWHRVTDLIKIFIEGYGIQVVLYDPIKERSNAYGRSTS